MQRDEVVSSWEFDCPQFFDFSAGLENTHTTEDIFVGVSNNGVLCERYTKASVPRMATPKIRLMKPLKNSPFVNTSRTPYQTDDEKAAVQKVMHSRLSKSDGCLSGAIKLNIENNVNIPLKSYRKRSLSERCVKEKKVVSLVPNCFTRPKGKKGKTTEELEMERIVQLRNVLKQHLRLNEANLKRMKVNKAPLTFRKMAKIYNAVPLKSKDLRIPTPALAQSVDRKLRCHSENTGDNMPIYKELVDNPKLESAKIQKKKIQSITNVLRDLNRLEIDSRKKLKKLIFFETSKLHCGLKFVPKLKGAKPENFSFYASTFNASRHMILV